MTDAAAELNASVFTLLASSRWANKGADEAKAAGDVAWECKLRRKAETKLNEANELDPDHRCPAWEDHLRGTH